MSSHVSVCPSMCLSVQNTSFCPSSGGAIKSHSVTALVLVSRSIPELQNMPLNCAFVSFVQQTAIDLPINFHSPFHVPSSKDWGHIVLLCPSVCLHKLDMKT